jgi:hypothetical protein
VTFHFTKVSDLIYHIKCLFQWAIVSAESNQLSKVFSFLLITVKLPKVQSEFSCPHWSPQLYTNFITQLNDMISIIELLKGMLTLFNSILSVNRGFNCPLIEGHVLKSLIFRISQFATYIDRLNLIAPWFYSHLGSQTGLLKTSRSWLHWHLRTLRGQLAKYSSILIQWPLLNLITITGKGYLSRNCRLILTFLADLLD